MIAFSPLTTLFKLQVQSTFSYRGMMLIWMLHTFFTPFTMFLIWYQMSATNASIAAVMPQITYFYLFLPLATNLAGAWQGAFLANTIRTGELSMYLIKPFSHVWHDLTNNLSEKVLKTLILVPFIIIGFLIFRPSLALSFSTLCLFTLSLLWGAALNFVLEQAMGYSAFWLDDISGLRNLKDIGFFTFGGAVLPVFLFPEHLKSLASMLPFRYLGTFSVEILSHALTPAEVFQGFIIQVLYTAVALWLAVFLWHHGSRRYSAYGG